MSKTDKTKPYRVRIEEHKNLLLIRYTWGFWYGCCTGCGCTLCTGQYWRKLDNRRFRHEAKRLLRKGDFEVPNKFKKSW